MKSHTKSHNLDEPFKSAYKEYHSTETTLVHVGNDILKAFDNNDVVLFVLLDLCTAFDMVMSYMWIQYHLTLLLLELPLHSLIHI